MTSVVLVDDHQLVRQAVARMLDSEPDLSVVGQAGSVAEALPLIASTSPDAVVTDVSMPGDSGLQLVRKVREGSERTAIVVLTMFDDDATLLGALDAGASGLVLKTAPAEAVAEAVRRAVQAPLSFAAEGLAAAFRRQGSRPTLTPREADVLQHLADGQSVAAIAKALYLSESTVKTHITKIYDKLGARTRAGAVMAAIKQGLVRADSAG